MAPPGDSFWNSLSNLSLVKASICSRTFTLSTLGFPIFIRGIDYLIILFHIE
nr:MAG TPA: hypothetical protein [Caudoviricetes sp.]